MDDNKLGSRINGGNTAYKRNAGDYYPTPEDATIALLQSPAARLFKGKTIWEPACGAGHMARVFESCGITTVSSDIEKVCYGAGEINFLNAEKRAADFIITNPPFSISEQFITKCIDLGGDFALLLKSQYWHAKRRYEVFKAFSPEYVMPLTWRPDFLFQTRGGGSPLMDVIWCVWGSSTAEITKYIPLQKPTTRTKADIP